VGLAGSLPLVEGKVAPGLYAEAIAAIHAGNPGSVISLDVGGAPLRACLSAPPQGQPDFLCINTDESLGAGAELWEAYRGTAVVHDKRGCWVVRGGEGDPGPGARPPDVATPSEVRVIHTICAGDASHGGLILGLMLFGTEPTGVLQAARLSQACGLTVVESPDSIRGLTAEKVEANLARL
jgi:sugar/nucleoside kinase (ribokinase family)